MVYDGNLLYHGCVAMNEDGEFRAFNVDGESFSGRAFLDRVDQLARQGYFDIDNPAQKQYGMDVMWFLWCSRLAPPVLSLVDDHKPARHSSTAVSEYGTTH